MLFRSINAFQEDASPRKAGVETIVRRSTSGRLYTIELSTAPAQGKPQAYDAHVAQMAAMNRPLGFCQGTSRDDVIRKACAMIDAAIPHALTKAA